MFTKKSREDKDALYITFLHQNGETREYIPSEYNKHEVWLRRQYIYFMFRFHKYFPNYYYWHIRHMLTAKDRKIQDLQFMIHVFNDHNGIPENRRERWFYGHCWKLYGKEFIDLIAPKIILNEEGDVPNHEYALAYYKRWLREPRPNIKISYHGVSLFELEEIFHEIDHIYHAEYIKLRNRTNYEKRKLKKETNKKTKK